MRILSSSEAREAARDIRDIITSSGETAVVLRRIEAENLYGTDEGEFRAVGEVPVEVTLTPPTDLKDSVDARACVLAEADVATGNRVRYLGVTYRVQTAAPQSLFGVTTHVVLELVKLES